MSIAKLKRLLGGAALVVGLAVTGCAIPPEEPAPVVEQTVQDASWAPMTDQQKKQQLQSMHDRVTMIFINQPQFGGGRMMVMSPDHDIVHAPKSKQPVQPNNWKPEGKANPPHVSFQKGVENLYLSQWFNDANESWDFRKVQLVGLVKHPDPVAYDSDKVPMAKGVGDLPTRTLDDFELRALKKLREGEDLYVEKLPTGKVRVLGAIYAGARCAACHEQPGQLLGAFTYTFDIAPPKGKAVGGPGATIVPLP